MLPPFFQLSFFGSMIFVHFFLLFIIRTFSSTTTLASFVVGLGTSTRTYYRGGTASSSTSQLSQHHLFLPKSQSNIVSTRVILPDKRRQRLSRSSWAIWNKQPGFVSRTITTTILQMNHGLHEEERIDDDNNNNNNKNKNKSKIQSLVEMVEHQHWMVCANNLTSFFQDESRNNLNQEHNEDIPTTEHKRGSIPNSSINFEWISTTFPKSSSTTTIDTDETKQSNLARNILLRTIDNEEHDVAVLESKVVNMIQNRLKRYMETKTKNNKMIDSSFSTLLPGYLEVLWQDLMEVDEDNKNRDDNDNCDDKDIAHDETLQVAINRALITHIYPLIRHVFRGHEEDGDGNKNLLRLSDNLPLSVCDARIVRYGVPKSTTSSRRSGQERPLQQPPLQCGKGLITIRIGLSADSPDMESDARKSGVFFENLMDTNSNQQIPFFELRSGHAMIYSSAERHTPILIPGSVREELVLSITIRLPTDNQKSYIHDDWKKATMPERHQQLKAYLASMPSYDRMELIQQYLLKENPKDGAAHFCLGFDILHTKGLKDDVTESQETTAVSSSAPNSSPTTTSSDLVEKDRHRWNAIHEAISHLEMATELCPNDSRVYFQLGHALASRYNFVNERPRGLLLHEEKSTSNHELEKIVYVLERSMQIEKVYVDSGIRNTDSDLVMVLQLLGDLYARLGRFDDLIRTIDEKHRLNSKKIQFAIEQLGNNPTGLKISKEMEPSIGVAPDYEWIHGGVVKSDPHKVAIRTLGNEPILDSDTLLLIRQAAQRHWQQVNGRGTSRYTMQYEGNSECHLDELCAADPVLQAKMDTLLVNKIYPLVRKAFHEDGLGVPETPLCVYNALVIRYDGEKAKMNGRVGASQPLHRDGGLFSVNIALNNHNHINEAERGFQGGGTFFENLIDNSFKNDYVQRPLSPGHAVAHRSSERHAGAPTTAGIREILVLFLTTRLSERIADIDIRAQGTPPIERAFHLKMLTQKKLPSILTTPLCDSTILECLQLAVQENSLDGEAFYGLGIHTIKGDDNTLCEARWKQINQAIGYFKRASQICPSEANIRSSLGVAYARRWAYYSKQSKTSNNTSIILPTTDFGEFSYEGEMEKTINELETAVRLEAACSTAGCGESSMNIASTYQVLEEVLRTLGRHEQADKLVAKYGNDIAESVRLVRH